ncbi:AprI/Inh family metalloprotease inhibitor [Serratia marcescens]|uniref:AprI/Inh family metalloprotease inhibitor n=1 Tax=Serratia marcescens TaxID=615 RepID=UPI000E2F875C|nr:AprI/Inh family metalloprotease inhibitor [Serratia marcescens]
MKGTLACTALAAGGMMVTSAVMAGSERQCQIEFLADEQSETNGYQLVDRQHCLQSVFAAEVVGWRPAPDGIALLRADGSTLAFFSRDGDLYRNQLGADEALTLKALA